jgi:hypothetical protein
MNMLETNSQTVPSKNLKAKHAYFETVAARLEALELRTTPIQITAEKSLGEKMVHEMP